MNAVDKLNKKAIKAAKRLKFELIYIPGLVEELDQYKATYEGLFTINCYGPTKEEALSSAIEEASRLLLDDPQQIRNLLK